MKERTRFSHWRSTGSEMVALLGLALPIAAGQIGQILLGVADTVMIGRVGVVPLGAAAFANTLFMVFHLVGIGLLGGVNVLTARARGRGDIQGGAQILRHSLVFGGGLGLATMILCFLLYPLLGHMGQPREVIAEAGPYFLILSGSLLPLFLFHALKQFREGLTQVWPPFYFLLGGILLNIFLNWVFIFGNLGAPALGLLGAGWATFIARWAMFFLLLWHTLSSPSCRLYRPAMVWGQWDPVQWRGLLHFGIPMAGQLLFEVGAFAGAGIMVGWIGSEALAAHQIALTCASATFMIPLGISLALSIRVGEKAGKEAFANLRMLSCSGVALSAFFMAMGTVFFLLYGGWLAGFFISDPAVVALAAILLVVAGLFQIFDGTQVVCMGGLRGLGDVLVPTIITFFAYWVVALPTAFILGFTFEGGAPGVWGGLAAGLAVSSLILLGRLWAKTGAVQRMAAEKRGLPVDG